MDVRLEPCDCEKIDAVRIRLCGAAHTTAVLSEFRVADRLLAAWLAQAAHALSVDFQVTFLDGFVLCGCYEYCRRARGKPSFSAFVRATLDATPALARYSIDS